MASSDVDSWIEQLRNARTLNERDVKDLCNRARDVLLGESNTPSIASPVTVCGDIHGQLQDLVELFRIGGQLPSTRYIFMGDYVDRGHYSVETFLLLIAYKVRYPDCITLLRGNHESRTITQTYGFYDECLRKYNSISVWHSCCNVFDCLNLAATIDDRIFCVHGGLSPEISTIDQIRTLDRQQEVPVEGAMCDLLWSDPEDIQGWSVSSRGSGFVFGEDIVQKFNNDNDIALIARSHQLVLDGYREMFGQTLVTVWSAPNYSYRCGNAAVVMQVVPNKPRPTYVPFAAVSKEAPGDVARRPIPDYFL